MKLINKYTGKEQTPKELKAIKIRAKKILSSPYASPEQTEWAMNAYPEGFGEVLLSIRQKNEYRRKR